MLYNIAFLSIFLPIVISLFMYKTINHRLRLLAFYFYLSAFTELLAKIFKYYFKSNLIVYRGWEIVEYLIIALILAALFKNSKYCRGILISIPLFIAVWILLLIFGLDSINNITSIPSLFGYFIFIFLSMKHLYTISKNTEILLLKNYSFWLCSGILAYFAFNILIFVLSIMISVDRLNAIWEIHAVIVIISNILFSIAFFAYYKWRPVEIAH